MKRIITIITVIAILFSLCPSAMAKGDDNIDALKKRIEELEAEIAKKDEIIAQKDAVITALAGSVTGKPEAEQEKSVNTDTYKGEFDDAIAIEDCRFQLMPLIGKIEISMKIRNNYVPEKGQNSADRIGWDAQVLDKQGDVIDTLHYSYQGVDYGEAVWDARRTSIDNLSEISAIRVKTYMLYKMGGSNNSTFLGSGKLSEPAVFQIDDIDINTEKSVSEELNNVIDALLKGWE